MQFGLPVLALLWTVFLCSGEERLLQKDGVEPKHDRRKRDLKDAESLLKTLLSKRDHAKTHEDYEDDYDERGSEFLRDDSGHYEAGESGGGHRVASHDNAKKEIVLTEDEMVELFKKMANMFSAGKASSEKGAYYEEDDDEHVPRAVLIDSQRLKKKDVFKVQSDSDKFSDEDVALAETLAHMKETGATAAYPDVKMAALYDKGPEDKEEYRAVEDRMRHTDESFLKKVDEIGKSLVKEEVHTHVKDEGVHEYLKKDEAHHGKGFLAHGIDEKLLKELKHSFAAGTDLAADEDEMLLLGKSLHKDGEVHDELLKKAKTLLNGELDGEDHEKVLELVKHLEQELMDRELSHKGLKEEKDIHAMLAEKEISGEKKHSSKEIYGAERFLDKEFSAENPYEIDSKGLIGKEHGGEHLMKGILAHGIDDELLKKLKSLLGAGKEFKTGAGEFLGKEFHKGAEFDKEHKDLTHLLEEFDKETALKEGTEAYAKAKEQAHKDAHIGFEESETKKHAEGSFAHGAHEESAHKGYDEAELKKHIEGSLSHGAHLGFDKEGRERVEDSFAHSAHDVHEKGVYKGFEEEQIKKHLEGSHAVLGKDAHKIFSEEEMKKHLEGSLEHGSHVFQEKDAHKGFNEEEMKKHIESSLEHGSHAFHEKDSHRGFNEEELKKHIESSYGKEHGIAKDHAIGTHLQFGAGHAVEKVHGIDSKEIKGSAGKAHEADSHELKHHLAGEEIDHGYASRDFHGREHSVKKGLAAEGTHGIHRKVETGVDKSLHGIFEEGEEKKIRHHDGEKHLISHGTAHDSDKAFKVHEDEFFRKEKAYGTDAFLPEVKEFAEEDHHIHHVFKDEEGKHHSEGGAEGTRKVSHRLKSRVYELLAELVRTTKCHLVTMRPTELLGIVNCISKKKDPLLCEKFAACESKMPPRVIEALEECRKKITPGELKKCSRHAPLFPSRDIPLKIFQCMAVKVREVFGEERKKMIEFEKCARVVKMESCERVTWYHRRH